VTPETREWARGRLGTEVLRHAARWLGEPLVQFLILGAGLFLLWSLMGEKPAAATRIVVTAGQVRHLIEIFERTHLRPPAPGELQSLIDREVRNEVYYREGIRLGLDRDDEIIRRRLAQKVQFVLQDNTEPEAPGDTTLQEFLDRHPGAYGGEPSVAFSQIYLNPERHRDAQDADRVLARLEAGSGRIDYAADADPLPVPADFELTPLSTVQRVFGSTFAAALIQQPVGRWVGPIRSGFGTHLVLLRKVVAGRHPRLEDVREAVQRDWHAEQRARANDESYRRMLSNYRIAIESPPPAVTAAVETPPQALR
jgi:hypothetical protein